MFGSAFLLKPKPGERDALIATVASEQEQRKIKGYVAGYRLEKANGDIWVLAVFEDEKSYRDNAADPAQDKAYRAMRSHLTADPEWNDGTITELRG